MQHLQKTRGQGRLWSFNVPTRFNGCLRPISFPFTFLRTLWHGAKLNPFVFRRFRTLCQKHPGWGSALATLSLLGRSLRTGPSVSPNASPFNLQLSTVNPPLGHLFHSHGTRITRLRAICRIHYLSRRRASDVLLEREVRSTKLFPGHSSVVSKYVYYVGGCDG